MRTLTTHEVAGGWGLAEVRPVVVPEDARKGIVLVTNAGETQGKGSVFVTNAVETQGKDSLLHRHPDAIRVELAVPGGVRLASPDSVSVCYPPPPHFGRCANGNMRGSTADISRARHWLDEPSPAAGCRRGRFRSLRAPAAAKAGLLSQLRYRSSTRNAAASQLASQRVPLIITSFKTSRSSCETLKRS